MTSIACVVLNGERGDLAALTPWLRALERESILAEKGGYLFKAGFDGAVVHIVVAPCLMQGQRNYHHAMPLGHEGTTTLIGDVNARGVMEFCFKLPPGKITPEQQGALLDAARRFACLMLDGGYRGAGTLSEVTQGMLAELGCTPPPDTLCKLAAC